MAIRRLLTLVRQQDKNACSYSVRCEPLFITKPLFHRGTRRTCCSFDTRTFFTDNHGGLLGDFRSPKLVGQTQYQADA